jgi:hypothetical protein
MASPISVLFVGGSSGAWRIDKLSAVRGECLPQAGRLAVYERPAVALGEAGNFCLRGSTGHLRYVEEPEKSALAAVTPPLARPEATRAALIPIRKSDAWWELAQDQRREILERRSQHISLGLRYLPAIARRLYHARELGEPFDFYTWFEYAPAHSAQFEELVQALRESEEWSYVEREVDVRLTRA